MLRNLAVVFGTTLLASSVVHALGMGGIKVNSALNQPLDAEIELVALRGTTIDEIRASMAKDEEFQKAGIERVHALNGLNFIIEGRGADAIVRLKSNDVIREPFLNFVVEVNWPNGRLLREYTVLLDPPTFASAPVQRAPVARPDAPVSNTGTVTTRPTPAAREPSGQYTGSSYGPIGSNDTLWSIATRARPNDSVSIHQTLAAIFKANPQAFGNNNPNVLLQGETLRIPSAEEIAAVPRRGSLAELVGSTPVVETARRSSGSGASSSSTGGRLSLGSGKASGDGRGGSDREATEVLNQENEALRERLGSQEKKIERLEKLLELKDQQLASVGGATSTPSTTELNTPVETTPTISEPVTTQPEAISTDTPSDVAANTEQPVTTPDTNNEPVRIENEKKPVKKPIKTPEKVEEPSFFDDLFSGDGLLYLGGFGGLLLLVGGFMVWQRRRVAEENFHESLMPSENFDNFDNSFTEETEFDLPEVGEELLSPEEADSAPDHNEVVADPLGEADIYIAYGKYEQAEQLLVRALRDEPNRTDLRLKLLEAYAEMHESDKFRAQVDELQSAMDLDASLSAQVQKIQSKAWPDDSMAQNYRAAPIAPSADDIFGSMGVGASAEKTVEIPRTKAPIPEQSKRHEETPDFSSNEFSLDLDAELKPSDDLLSDSHSLSSGNSDSEFEFSLDDVEDSSFSLDSADTAKSGSDSSFDLDDVNSDFAESDDLGMNEIDEIATKLDLARAYIEMHETDGAKEILQEVVSDGNDAQRKEAQALLAKI